MIAHILYRQNTEYDKQCRKPLMSVVILFKLLLLLFDHHQNIISSSIKKYITFKFKINGMYFFRPIC